MFSQSRLGLPGKCADGGVPSPSPGSAIEPVAYPVPAPRGSLCLPGRRCLADERLAAAAPAPGSDASSTGDPLAARIAPQSSAGWFAGLPVVGQRHRPCRACAWYTASLPLVGSAFCSPCVVTDYRRIGLRCGIKVIGAANVVVLDRRLNG